MIQGILLIKSYTYMAQILHFMCCEGDGLLFAITTKKTRLCARVKLFLNNIATIDNTTSHTFFVSHDPTGDNLSSA